MHPPHLGDPKDIEPFIEALKKKGNIKLVSFLSSIGNENNHVYNIIPHCLLPGFVILFSIFEMY